MENYEPKVEMHSFARQQVTSRYSDVLGFSTYRTRTVHTRHAPYRKCVSRAPSQNQNQTQDVFATKFVGRL